MKSLITKFAAGVFALASFSLSSCKKDEVQATVSTTSPTLTASTNSVVLLQANSAQTAVTFTWTPIAFSWTNAEHTYNPTVTYTFELDKKGNNFAKPTTFSAGSTPPTTFTVGALNDLLTGAGYATGTAADLEIRLGARYASNVATLYSSTVALKATPYLFICNAPAGSASWSIIGPAGVDWNTDVPLKYNCNTNTFDLTRTLKAGEFKFRANSDWTISYGSTTARNSSGTAPIDTNNNNNITVPTAGTYTISLDLNNMTYTLK